MLESSIGVGIKPIGPAWDKRQKEEPWPDGPRFEVSEEFQRAFLTTDACETMIAEDPVLAREILLATLIEEPRYPILPGDFGYSAADKNAGLTLKDFFDPPFYDQGPFLTFLEAQPEIGLDAVMRLINFASERWAKEVKKRIKSDVSSVSVWIEGQNQRWSGDWRLYYGYRGSSLINDSLACALMALERWLHERFEASEDLAPAFAKLLEHSRSVGVAGVLISFGKRDPQLLLGPLAALIGVPEFYLWEDQHNAQFSAELAPGTENLEAAHRRRVEWAGTALQAEETATNLFASLCHERECPGADRGTGGAVETPVARTSRPGSETQFSFTTGERFRFFPMDSRC